jgi:predicted dithiol-disulfide oxidoreductase (DUF899 family)
MTLPKIASRDEWLAARIGLLDQEKALTQQRDALNARRRELPMVEITKDYAFEGPGGRVGMLDLFEGRDQLIVYHFMFDPSWDDGCPSCTAGTDEITPGFLDHLHTRGTTYALVSLAPLPKLERWRALRGWDHIPWYSSFGTSFNADFGVTVPPGPGAVYNFRTRAEYEAKGDELGEGEYPGRSCFLRVDDRIFHTYSQYARGLESTGGSYYFLDLTALGRQEDWEEPAGRSDAVRGNQPDFAS